MTENQTPDAFEAALAANADELTAGVDAPVEEVVAEVISTDAPVDDLALASDEDGDLESDENDPNAEFRRTLRAAIGDWYVVHSYAGYEKKVRDNLHNRINFTSHGRLHFPD
jgi:transcription termination/antitermination protein NusG